MSRNHFDIERPRKISIAINGYDGAAQAKDREKRRREQVAKVQRAADKAREKRMTEVVNQATVDDKRAELDLEQFANSDASSDQAKVMAALLEAFEPSAMNQCVDGEGK